MGSGGEGGDGGRPRQGEAEGGVEGSIIFLFVGVRVPSLLAIASKDGPPTPTKKENMKPSTPLSAPTLIPLSGRLPGGVKRGGGEGEGVVAEPAKLLFWIIQNITHCVLHDEVAIPDPPARTACRRHRCRHIVEGCGILWSIVEYCGVGSNTCSIVDEHGKLMNMVDSSWMSSTIVGAERKNDTHILQHE